MIRIILLILIILPLSSSSVAQEIAALQTATAEELPLFFEEEESRPAADTRDDVAAYTTVDLALTLKNFYRTLEIQGTVHNLFDENYEDPDTSGASQLIPADFPREGISGMLSVSYTF